MSLTKLELQDILSLLQRVSLGDLARPFTLMDRQVAEHLTMRLAESIDAAKPELEKGRLVLSWRLPKEWAPSLNSYAFMKGWQRTALRRTLDDSLRHNESFLAAALNLGKRKRWVRVTRFSTKVIDENSVDVLGGKMPIDALVRAEILVDDNQEWCVREGACMKTKLGNTHVLVEVFEVTTEGSNIAPPQDATAPKAPERKKRIIDE